MSLFAEAKQEASGHAETLPTRAKARPPAARRANGSTFRPTTASEARISTPSRRTPFPTAKAYSAGALKESSWASLSQGPRARRRRRAEPRSLCRRGADAEGSSLRSACARLRRSGAPADRPSSHRHDRRGRLLAGRSCRPCRAARRAARSRRGNLGVMQGFEPCGVFARDLRECLTLQLKELDRCDPAMAGLIEQSRPACRARSRLR